MSERFLIFLRRNTPPLSVMFFLAALNVVISATSGSWYPWAIFPILAMSIPVMVSFSQIMLAPRSEAETARDAERRSAPRATAAAGDAIQAQLDQAAAYQRALGELTRGATNSAQASRLSDLSVQFAGWVKSVNQMAERIRAYRTNPVIQQDLSRVPESIRQLETQLAGERDERMKAQLEESLQARRAQLTSLQRLDTTMRQGALQLENTVAALGTIYSQALVGQTTSDVADYSDLAANMNERVAGLRDQVEAIEEVKLGNARQTLDGSNRPA